MVKEVIKIIFGMLILVTSSALYATRWSEKLIDDPISGNKCKVPTLLGYWGGGHNLRYEPCFFGGLQHYGIVFSIADNRG